PQFAAMIPERLEMVIQEGQYLFETIHVGKDGHAIPTEISSRLIDFNGKKAILSVARDISERKRAEKQLQTSYLFLKAANLHTQMPSLLYESLKIIKDLTECEAIAIQIMDDGGKMLYQTHIGFSGEFMNPENISLFQKCTGAHFTDSKENKENITVFTENRSFFMNKVGKERNTTLNGVDVSNECVRSHYHSMAFIPIPQKDRTLGIIYIADHQKDKFTPDLIEILEKAALQLGISIQRIIMAEKLQESEKVARGLLNSMTEAAFLIKLDGTIIAANDEFCRRFDVSEDSIIGTYSFDLLPPEIATYRKSMAEKVISTRKPVQFEDMRNGRHILNSIYPVFNNRGAVEKLAIFGYDITDQKEAEERIRASLQEKEVLLKEIHHRVKNNMQIICSLLNLQSRYIKDGDTVKILRESQNRVKSMALVHEKLYQSQDFTKIDFVVYVKTLIREIVHSYGNNMRKITVDLHVDSIFLGIDTAIPCGLIINELLSNAFIHAFPNKKKGKVCISLNINKDGQYELDISDDGIGIPPHIAPETTESLGLHLVDILVKDQLRGTLKVERTHGTAYHICFGDDQ
ncbi:MAG: PAS domain S-box protein, partial [Theionarchaea archaeon]|nr:PAS domain S-box protein [Theionarchaea archaeon]